MARTPEPRRCEQAESLNSSPEDQGAIRKALLLIDGVFAGTGSKSSTVNTVARAGLGLVTMSARRQSHCFFRKRIALVENIFD